MKSFSENIDGSNLYGPPGDREPALEPEIERGVENFAPADVTIEMIRHGTSRKSKLALYFKYAGITTSKHKNFIKKKIQENWVDWQNLDPGGFQGDYYNTEFLKKLQGWDKDFTFKGVRGVGTHVSGSKLEQIEKEIEDMIKKKVPGMTLQDRQRIWKSKGHVPPWWDPIPETKSLTYYMKKIIQAQKASAADIETAIAKAGTGEMTDEHKRLVRLGFPSYEAERIIAGKRDYDPKMMKRVRGFGEFYHRDVGFYS